MYKSTDQLFHEFLEDTVAYRCEYLKILIKKYVKTKEKNDDVVDMLSFQITTVSTNFKKMKKKTFGSVSSYYCESAKKTTNYWKQKIISGKRASFRKYVAGKSSNGEFKCARSKRNLKKYNKAYESCSSDEESESTFPYERDVTYEDHSSLSALENESITSYEDHSSLSALENESITSYEDSSFSSDTTIIASERSQNTSTKNETNKFLMPNDKKYSLGTNNAQLLSNSQMTVLKLNHPKQVQVLIKNFSSLSNSKCNDIVYEKLNLCYSASISSTKSKEKSKRSIHSSLSVCNLNSFADYVSSISPTPNKFKFSDIGSGISSKIHQVPSVSDDKSLHTTVPKIKANDTRVERSKIYSHDLSFVSAKPLAYASNKPTRSSKFRFNESGMEKPKDYCQASVSISKSLCVSSKVTLPSKMRFCETGLENPKENCKTQSASLSPSRYYLRNSVKVDTFMNKKVSDDKKSCKTGSSLVQSTIPFRKSKSKDVYKKCYNYLEKDCVPIDDLSIKSFQTKKEEKIKQKKISVK